MADEREQKKNKICAIFKSIRRLKKNKDKMEELVEELEDEKTLDSCSYGEHFRTFSVAYTIKLYEKNIREPRDRELLLAVCGLLNGYDNKLLGERRRQYLDAAEFDERINPHLSDITKLYKNIEDPIIDKLVEKIILQIFDANDNKKPLGLAKEVDKYLSEEFPNGLPEKLPLGQPLYLSMSSNPPSSSTTNVSAGEGDNISPRRKRNWELIIIIVVVVVVIFVGIMAFRAKKDSDQDSVDNSSRQNNSPAKINYPDGISVDVSGSVSVSRGEKGEVIITYIDDGFGAIDNKDSDSQKGVDNHEKNQ